MSPELAPLLFLGVILVFFVGAAIIIGLVVMIFVFGVRFNRGRHQAGLDAVLNDWARKNGFQLLAANPVERSDDHPFQDQFGWTGKMHNYGGAIRRVRVRDDEGDLRDGWLYVPYKPKSGLYLAGRKSRSSSIP